MAPADDINDVRARVALAAKLFHSRDVALAARVFAPDVTWQDPFGVLVDEMIMDEPLP